jgi:hypothetical protein
LHVRLGQAAGATAPHHVQLPQRTDSAGEVEDFPAFIVVDDKGNDFFTDPSGAVTVPLSGIRVRSDG